MAKAETIFGWTVERITDRRVRITKGDREITMKGGPDLEGDALVKAAIDQGEAAPTVPPEGAHVVDVPVGTMDGTGKAT